MPFRKIEVGPNKGKYQGPSGKMFTRRQVVLYYTGGKSFPGQKKKSKK